MGRYFKFGPQEPPFKNRVFLEQKQKEEEKKLHS